MPREHKKNKLLCIRRKQNTITYNFSQQKISSCAYFLFVCFPLVCFQVVTGSPVHSVDTLCQRTDPRLIMQIAKTIFQDEKSKSDSGAPSHFDPRIWRMSRTKMSMQNSNCRLIQTTPAVILMNCTLWIQPRHPQKWLKFKKNYERAGPQIFFDGLHAFAERHRTLF